MDEKQVFTLNEAAQYLQVSTQTVRKLIGDGLLPAKQVGRLWRVRKEDIESFLKGDKVNDDQDIF